MSEFLAFSYVLLLLVLLMPLLCACYVSDMWDSTLLLSVQLCVGGVRYRTNWLHGGYFHVTKKSKGKLHISGYTFDPKL